MQHHSMIAPTSPPPPQVFVGCGLAITGYTLVVEESAAADLWSLLVARGAVPMGSDEWEVLRVLQGRPAPGRELTEEHTPLEAGLYHAVSLAKGCYIGQETLAKVHNTGGLRQQLWGLQLEEGARCAVGDSVASADASGDPIGKVTSVATKTNGDVFALAYLKCRSGGAQVQLRGLKVIVGTGGAVATVAELPYACREFSPGQAPEAAVSGGAAAGASSIGSSGEADLGARAEEARRAKQSAKEEEEAARAARLAAMQERLAAWQAQQKQPQAGAAGAGSAQPPQTQ